MRRSRRAPVGEAPPSTNWWRPFSWVLDHVGALVPVLYAVPGGVLTIGLVAGAPQGVLLVLVGVLSLAALAGLILVVLGRQVAGRSVRRAGTVENEWVPLRSAEAYSGRWRAIGRFGADAVAFRRESRRGVAVTFHGVGSGPIHGVVVKSPRPGPTVSLVPDSRWEQRAGAGEVDLESAAFNDRWRPSGEVLRYTHAVLNPRVMERLMQADTEGLSVLLEGPHLVVYGRVSFDLAHSDRMAEVAFDLRDLLRPVRDMTKPSNWRGLGYRPGTSWLPEP